MAAALLLATTSCSTYHKYSTPNKTSKKASCRSVKTKQFGKVY